MSAAALHLHRGALLQQTRAGVVGGLAGLATIAAAVFFVSKRRQQGAAPSLPRRACRQRLHLCHPAQRSPAASAYQCRLRCRHCTAPPADVCAVGVFTPFWVPAEMQGEMKALEDAAEELIAALSRGNKAALGG